MSGNTSNEVFEYTGKGQSVPKDVTSVRFHPTVIKVDDKAFYECSDLREVVLNEGLQYIGRTVFFGCESLTSITIPSSVNEIGCNAFVACLNLKEVVLNEGLKKIEGCAFSGCRSLESITIPSSVTDIGISAFISCRNLKEVLCSEVLPMIKPNAFSNCPALERIIFPSISSRLDNIVRAGQVDIQNKIQKYFRKGEIEWKRGDSIYIPVEVTTRWCGWGLVQHRFHQIVNWIKYYEIKEATTLFELALWKANMVDQVHEADPHDRDAYRVEVPGPVKDAILQYLP